MPRKAKQEASKPLLAVVADVHLGNFRDFGEATAPDGLNTRGKLTLDTFSHAVQKAFGIGIPLAVAGDVFHHKRPEPAIIAGAASRIVGEVVVIPGNHDMIDASAEGRNTACETVSLQARVIDYEHTWHLAGGRGALCIPFDARKSMAEFLEEQLRIRDHDPEVRGELVLVTHVGVVDDNSPPWLREAGDAIHKDRLFDLMDREDIVVAFVGNYHQHREWERGSRKIVQVGALNPTGFADAGLEGYGGFAVWYGGTDVRWESIPGPRFLRVHAHQPFPEMPKGCSVFVRGDRGAEDLEGVMSDPGVAGFEEVDPEPTFLEQQDLAKPDKLVEGAEAALEEYVSKMPLPDGLSKAAVLDAVKGLWRRST